ncbi:MAG: dihydroorotate dehydrogenase [Thermoplasmata archaeon]|nr:dihydroorotate dehydrogenase [Thermoplasmata archaeon]
MAELRTRIAGLEMENPTMLASGILGQTGESLFRIVREGGAGAVVTKSIGLEPREGHGSPCLLELDNGILNAMGLPNPGIDSFGEEMAVALKAGAPVIGSIFSDSPSNFAALARKMEGYGAAAVELNLSCPHAEKFGLDTGSDPAKVAEIVSAVKSAVKMPVFAKLSPMVPDITAIALAAEDAGCDAIVAINTMRAMKIDIDIGKPVLRNKVGGLSGRAIKPVGVRAVYEIAGRVKVPVIGAGGVYTGRDAVEYLMAGASAVQIGSAVRERGIGAFGIVSAEIAEFMKENKYKSLNEIIGLARGK